ncbi:ABC transporter ATP-binding protein [Bordetella genomosp. 2]|uniref:ABC transporter ATP-binding protein n=2 Tax=Bordetella TaxID=517 RepID=A0A261VHH9_9BORD|nr:ABC transporter ATP-binding protein [Bordetella genomosp. 2]OZI73614.1 ABC transporter ATP-binding protein [Bordetella genomosp. 2]
MKGAGIVLEGLTKRYAGQAVVDRISAAIPAGSFFSLLGPSGSGKTTTLMMIAGFAAPDDGRLLLDGRDITGQTPQQRGLGMVFQNYALFPHLSVEQNVAFPLQVRRCKPAEIRDKVRWALDVVQLSALASRRPRQLSGGQQQRVALARAIAFEPGVVLMDEPLGALDKNLRYRMQVEIKEIQQRLGMTVVYVTHDQEEAMNMSDCIAIMDRGRIAQMGSARQVYEDPNSCFVAKFLGEANLLPAQAVPGYEHHRDTAVFVRPERVRLQAARGPASAGMISVPGLVTRASFLGHIVRYSVETRSGHRLTVDAPNSGDAPPFDMGAEVAAQWRPADTRILANG